MSESDFFEKQYLGLNKVSLGSRLALSTFCFLVYYWRENINKEGELFFSLELLFYSLYYYFLYFIFKLKYLTEVLSLMACGRQEKLKSTYQV
jgi:ABC-type multidrug transport system permease subunit